MTVTTLKATGRFLYSIGALILVPAGAVFLTSANTLMLAGPIVMLIPLTGAIFVGAGRWLTQKAWRLEQAQQANAR